MTEKPKKLAPYLVFAGEMREGVKAGFVAAVGPARYCSPPRPTRTHFEPSSYIEASYVEASTVCQRVQRHPARFETSLLAIHGIA
jgi:hypothetical protein